MIPATLFVTANSVTRPYLASNPTFTASYTGFVNGQGISALVGEPTLTTSPLTNSLSPIGTYPIIITDGTALPYCLELWIQFCGWRADDNCDNVNNQRHIVITHIHIRKLGHLYSNGQRHRDRIGNVQRRRDNAWCGIVSSGTASYSTSLLSAGTHTITAVYGGDTNFAGSTSSAIIQTVNKMATTTGVILRRQLVRHTELRSLLRRRLSALVRPAQLRLMVTGLPRLGTLSAHSPTRPSMSLPSSAQARIR